MYNQIDKNMKKYIQIFMMLLMVSVDANVYCSEWFTKKIPAIPEEGITGKEGTEYTKQGFAEYFADPYVSEEKRQETVQILISEGFYERELSPSGYGAIVAAAIAIAALVEQQTGYFSRFYRFAKGKIWGEEAYTFDEEEELRKIMEQLTHDEQRQAVELAGELIRAESKEAAAVEQIVEQPKKRPSRTGGRKTTRTRR